MVSSIQTSTTPKPRPSLKVIADLAGVSVATVSRALADDPKIAKTTRERVMEIAATLGYVPDRAARRLRTGRTMVINLMLDPHFEVLGFGNALLLGVSHALKESGYHLVVTPHYAGEDPLELIQGIVLNRHADGVLFTRTEPLDSRVRFLLEQDFPFVSHGRTDFREPHSWVDYDNEAFAYSAATHLIKNGCRRLCTILPPPSLTFHQHLRAGVLRAVREAGGEAEFPTSVTLDSSMEEISEWGQKKLNSAASPDGFICPGEASYLALRNACAAQNLTIGKEVLAVTKSISGILPHIDPGAVVISENIQAAGEAMAKALLKRLSLPDSPPDQTLHTPPASVLGYP